MVEIKNSLFNINEYDNFSIEDANSELQIVNRMLDLCKEKSDHPVEYSNLIKEVVLLIIKDLCKNEKCSIYDIKLLSKKSTYSVVFEIGNKVLKLGNEREIIKFPLHPYIIKPLLRRYITDHNDGSKLFVEIVQKAQIDYITKEEFYNLYKGVRDLGIIWTDVNYRNIARLTGDNIIYWNKNLNPSCSSLSFTEKRGNIVLKKGDPIIIDADHMYDEKSGNITLVDDSYYTAFEYQYKIDRRKG